MTKKTRFIILAGCVLCFFALAPVLVAYSMGYRYDWEAKKVVATGGIYVRSFPPADKIIVDSKISQQPGFMSNWVFVQSLLPKQHTVLVQKEGYFDYQKTLPVHENLATKIENITLFKKDVKFLEIAKDVDRFYVSPDKQSVIIAKIGSKEIRFGYLSLNNSGQEKFATVSTGAKTDIADNIKWNNRSDKALATLQSSGKTAFHLIDISGEKMTAGRLAFLDKTEQQEFSPQNPAQIFFLKDKNLYLQGVEILSKAVLIEKKVLDYQIIEDKIYWISDDGKVNLSDLEGNDLVLPFVNFDFSKTNNVEFFPFDGSLFFVADGMLFLSEAGEPEKIGMANGAVFSPDRKNLAYFSNMEVWYYNLENKIAQLQQQEKNALLYSGNIKKCFWLNNNYIIFSDGDKIVISEIDSRGNINAVTLAEKKSPEIFYDSGIGKAIIKTGGVLLSTEKLIP